MRYVSKFFWTALLVDFALTAQLTFADTLDHIRQLAGCYLVDYSYSETQILDPNYRLDSRVYDVNTQTVKELIQVVEEAPTRIRLQHFLQADRFSGGSIFKMRHHAEIWHKSPNYRYRYLGRWNDSDRWDIETIANPENTWVREITNLDDGLRYQCIGSWLTDHVYPRFLCHAFAPIPGRETRDMGRTDYNTLERTAEISLYGDAWLERQRNRKVQFSNETRTPLVEEVGKIWSVKVPDSECSEIAEWAGERQEFWDVLADVWQDAYDGVRPFHEVKEVNGTTRGAKIQQLMEQYYRTIGSNPRHEQIVRQRLADIIEIHRQ